MSELDKMVYTAALQTADGRDRASGGGDDLGIDRTAGITGLIGERWKASITHARIPTSHAATSMLRSAWFRADRSRMWRARACLGD
jgi:hypothetical protein